MRRHAIEPHGTGPAAFALGEAERLADEAGARLEALERERARLLVEGTDAEVDAVEAGILARRREADRADAVAADLRRRLAAARAGRRPGRPGRPHGAPNPPPKAA